MKIDKDLCDICGTCASVCEKALITIKEFEVIVDNDRCTQCGKCLLICPTEAIKEVSNNE